MNSRPPTNMREALAAQTLEEIDGAIAKVEDLTLRVDQLGATIGAQSDALAAAAQNVREAVTAFSAQAKTELKDFLQASAAKTADEQRAALQEVVRAALAQEIGTARRVENSVSVGQLIIGGVVGIIISVALAFAVIRVFG
ncbi:hypothetical protein [Burkholderia ubonensis]|uniref:hypothetical protein n=1 Tax=Burkholderia ubonensis TaxID=101571 RepID=UPI002AAFE919|nr:hypothetical protein [Burkholderia ubonensis]